MAKQNIYLENILNEYDNVTYNWAMHMVNPQNSHRFEQNITSGNVKTLAHSGVESEINIQSVQQSLVTAFKSNQDRSSEANIFTFNLVEPGGATLYTRIVKAAQDLEIENHLQACYLLELKFLGYNTSGEQIVIPVGPYYHMCTMTGLQFQYAEGATTYRADLIETHQDAYKTQFLHLKQKPDAIEASTFGEFLQKLEEVVNHQEKLQTIHSPSKTVPNKYTFTVGDNTQNWLELPFGAGANNGDASLSSVSVTGDGNLRFQFTQGTSVSDAMVIALMQTEHFRKLPTAEGGHHKEHPDNAQAEAPTFEDLSEWFIFDNEVRYGHYDIVAKNYQRLITYNIYKFIEPSVVHDAISHQTFLSDEAGQKNRLKKIVNNGLLRKRFDYTYTGLNTEVLNLDVTLNNAYYQLQAINSGLLNNRSQFFGGASGQQDQLNITQTEVQRLDGLIQSNKAQIDSLKNKIEELDEIAGEVPDEISVGNIQEQNRQEIIRLEKEIQTLESKKGTALEEALEAMDKLPDAQARSIAQQKSRYITQDEVIGIESNSTQGLLPVSYMPVPIVSKATAGPDDPATGSAGAAFLGAVELNLNSLGDLVMQQISIKGDPYWLGKPKGSASVLQETVSPDGRAGANYQLGGTNYFLNLNFPTYPRHETGLMNIPEANFSISGLYRVYRVDATYQDGQFTMTLDAFRDVNTQIGLVWEEISSGIIDTDNILRQEEEYKKQEEDEQADTGADPIEEPGPDLGELEDGNVTAPTVTEAQNSPGTIRKQPIASDLKNILQTAATASGLNVVVYSGGQPEGGGERTGSTRHDNGHAADIRLQDASGRNLSLDNPADVPLIQNFLSEAKKAGATGIGAGNGYMGNNGFHVDNAAKYGQAPGGSSFWGGLADGQGRIRAKNAPSWLKTIMTG